MQDTIIKNWNGAVGRTDDVYILGDVFWKNEGAGKILNSLNGNKFLILGNHDRVNAEMKEHYVWVKEYAEIKDNGRHVVLCHYPISHWRGRITVRFTCMGIYTLGVTIDLLMSIRGL